MNLTLVLWSDGIYSQSNSNQFLLCSYAALQLVSISAAASLHAMWQNDIHVDGQWSAIGRQGSANGNGPSGSITRELACSTLARRWSSSVLFSFGCDSNCRESFMSNVLRCSFQSAILHIHFLYDGFTRGALCHNTLTYRNALKVQVHSFWFRKRTRKYMYKNTTRCLSGESKRDTHHILRGHWRPKLLTWGSAHFYAAVASLHPARRPFPPFISVYGASSGRSTAQTWTVMTPQLPGLSLVHMYNQWPLYSVHTHTKLGRFEYNCSANNPPFIKIIMSGFGDVFYSRAWSFLEAPVKVLVNKTTWHLRYYVSYISSDHKLNMATHATAVESLTSLQPRDLISISMMCFLCEVYSRAQVICILQSFVVFRHLTAASSDP